MRKYKITFTLFAFYFLLKIVVLNFVFNFPSSSTSFSPTNSTQTTLTKNTQSNSHLIFDLNPSYFCELEIETSETEALEEFDLPTIAHLFYQGILSLYSQQISLLFNHEWRKIARNETDLNQNTLLPFYILFKNLKIDTTS